MKSLLILLTLVTIGGACLEAHTSQNTPPVSTSECDQTLQPVVYHPTTPAHLGVYAQAFASLPHVLIDTGRRPREIGSFPASNEYDWEKMQWDDSPTDLVMGVATNTLWDIAVRKNAKGIVVIDWDPAVLWGQEFILRPLILNSKSPKQFLSRLFALPLPNNYQNLSIAELMNYFENNYSSLANQTELRLQLVRNTVDALQTDALRKQAILNYLTDLVNRGHAPDEYTANSLGFFIEPSVANLGNMTGYFVSRYKNRGADSRHRYFSHLSSQEAFERLQKIMQQHIFYIRAPLGHPTVLPAIRALATKFKWEKFTLGTSNVIDCFMELQCNRSLLTYQQIRQATELFASEQNPLVYLQTGGTTASHVYENYLIKRVDQIEEQMALNGRALTKDKFSLGYKSDMELIMAILHKETPKLLTSAEYRVLIGFGPHLTVQLDRFKMSLNKPNQAGKQNPLVPDQYSIESEIDQKTIFGEVLNLLQTHLANEAEVSLLLSYFTRRRAS